MTHTVHYANNQTLSFTACGDSSGFPILIQHGLIASVRGDYSLFDRLLQSGARLISIARPGYGDSSPYSLHNMAEWGKIVAVLVETLHLTRFDVLGLSSGAPYSYAIAHALPDKVRNVYIFSGIPALYDAEIQACWPYPINLQASLSDLQQLALDLFFSNLAPDALRQPDVYDSMRNQAFGPAQDLKLRCNTWGFTLADLQTPVYLEHSRDDADVPFITAELTAQRLPHCRFEIRDTGGHFSPELVDNFLKRVVANL
ncbi:MAG TPA: alpha/beta fold hydrolase [Aggregatilineaceae bacterium]|nr:alpha/beta fold hydrolase [Aggregatilineaceae bacterium]